MINHPVAYAFVAVFAVGIAIYEYVSYQKSKQKQHARPAPPPKRSPPPSPPPPKPPKKPTESKPQKPENSSSVKPKDSESNVRHRHINQKEKNSNESSDTTQSNSVVKKAISPPDSNQNDNQLSTSNNALQQNMDTKIYEKNVLDRLTNETKCINEEPKKAKSLWEGNDFEDSDSDNNDDDESDSKPISAEKCQVDCSAKNCASQSKVKKNQMKEEYKQTVCDKFKRDIEDESQETAACSSSRSDNDLNVEERKRFLESLEHKINEGLCCGCEKSACCALARPCGHCYLCNECAERILRIRPKCSICLADITEFQYYN